MEMKHIIAFAAVAALSVTASSCTREWIPTPDSYRPGNTDPAPSPEPDPETWTEIAGAGVALGEMEIIEQPAGTFMKGYWPDGKLIPVKRGGEWQLFWGEATDALTVADTPYPEDHVSSLVNSSKVWGKEFSNIDGFNDGGSWFIAIFPLDASGHYVGFFHAESHWPGSGIAYKSIGVVYSDDYGATWRDPEPIIMDSAAKPAEPAWTGLGDGCVIWDSANSRYICYYQGKVSGGANALCMASSSDPKGSPGTWKKWDGESFSIEACDQETALGGENVAIENLDSMTGANPSVMWNTFLEKWVMAYATWGKRVVISYSDDALHWVEPVKILGSIGVPAWYPNIIGEDGDLSGGEVVKIYWSHNQDDNGVRELAFCKLKFLKQ